MLVPLTSSLYVPGELSNLDEVIVDIGTGYYVSKVSLKSFPHLRSRIHWTSILPDLITDFLTVEKRCEGVL